MNDINNNAPEITTIEAARLLLEKMGVDLADLLATPAERLEVPVFEDYIPEVSEAVSDGTRRVYAPYWNRVLQAWALRRITEPTPSEISQLAEQVKATAVKRSNARGGRGAAEHLMRPPASSAARAGTANSPSSRPTPVMVSVPPGMRHGLGRPRRWLGGGCRTAGASSGGSRRHPRR